MSSRCKICNEYHATEEFTLQTNLKFQFTTSTSSYRLGIYTRLLPSQFSMLPDYCWPHLNATQNHTKILIDDQYFDGRSQKFNLKRPNVFGIKKAGMRQRWADDPGKANAAITDSHEPRILFDGVNKNNQVRFGESQFWEWERSHRMTDQLTDWLTDWLINRLQGIRNCLQSSS